MEQVTKFKAHNGRLFDTEKACIKYENDLKIEQDLGLLYEQNDISNNCTMDQSDITDFILMNVPELQKILKWDGNIK